MTHSTDKQFTVGDCKVTSYVFDTETDCLAFIKKRDRFQKRYSCFASSGKFYASYYDLLDGVVYLMHFANGGFRGIEGRNIRKMIEADSEQLNSIVYLD